MIENFKKRFINLFFPHSNISYSQSGEDILLSQHIFNGQNTGFYVDIGAHHPKRFSNTYLLYQKGWSGINIDPMPGMQHLFKERARDININAGISDQSGTKKYFMFKKGALNTFDAEVAKKQGSTYGQPTIKEVSVLRLEEVLNKYASGKKIDFMNIDVEGHEIEVLNSNDWNKYCPTIIAIEDQNLDISNPEKSTSYRFLKEKGYTLFNKLNYTAFYRKS